MVTVEVELDEETVRALSEEAAKFEFGGSEPYLRWLVEHRAVTLGDETEVRDRLLDLESRLAQLEANEASESDGPYDTNGEDVRAAIDDLLAVTEAADDDEVEEAVATIEGTVEDVDL